MICIATPQLIECKLVICQKCHRSALLILGPIFAIVTSQDQAKWTITRLKTEHTFLSEPMAKRMFQVVNNSELPHKSTTQHELGILHKDIFSRLTEEEQQIVLMGYNIISCNTKKC